MTSVRPTKRCLDDLAIPFPPLDVALSDVEHDLIAKAQRLPEEHASGGAERVRALTDHVWFKVKVGGYRGAGGQVHLRPDDIPLLWWLVAAGIRRSDTRAHDFYDQIEAECARAAKKQPKHAHKVSSDHLLPRDIDHRRYRLEQATLGIVALQKVVREAICRSAHSGRPVSVTSEGQRLIAWVRSGDGDTYLAIAAEGFLDPKQVAVLLDAIPGMSPDDWMPEPTEVLGIQPDVGQLVFSAMLPPHSLAAILAEASGGYL